MVCGIIFLVKNDVDFVISRSALFVMKIFRIGMRSFRLLFMKNRPEKIRPSEKMAEFGRGVFKLQ